MKYNSSKRYVKALWCVLLLFIAAPAVKAQVTVEATIDSLQLLIGEQAKIKLQVSMDANQKLRLPLLRDTLVTGVEILDVATPDTQLLNNDNIHLHSENVEEQILSAPDISQNQETLHPAFASRSNAVVKNNNHEKS